MFSSDDGAMIKAAVDGLSILTLAGWAVGALPAIATLLTILWTAIRIYETETVQKIVKRFRRSEKRPPEARESGRRR